MIFRSDGIFLSQILKKFQIFEQFLNFDFKVITRVFGLIFISTEIKLSWVRRDFLNQDLLKSLYLGILINYYFEGTHTLTLKLAYQKGSGLLLALKNLFTQKFLTQTLNHKANPHSKPNSKPNPTQSRT